jgi:hypothetical protein
MAAASSQGLPVSPVQPTKGTFEMSISLSLSAPLIERLRYFPAAVSTLELMDSAEELEALRSVCEDNDIDPDFAQHSFEKQSLKVTDLEDKISAHESFLEDCMNSLNGFWPTGADINDQTLLTAIVDAIRKGEGTTDL